MKGVKRFFKVLGIILVVLVITLIISISAIRLGLFPRIQTLIVTSTMTTLNHQYIAKIFASDERIKEIMNSNNVEDTTQTSDKSKIKVDEGTFVSSAHDSSNYEDEVKIIDVNGNGYKGHMIMVRDPKKIKLAVTKNLGISGAKLEGLIKQENGLAGVNAGGFSDRGGVGTGGIPTGIIVKDGEVVYRDTKQSNYSIIGFDKDGILTLGNYTLDQIKKLNIADAVSFGPYLIVNNNPVKINGDGGWGINPRTVIGQKADGTVLLLVIDGRQVSSIGATIKDVQNIMIKYGAVNAANLDGGASTVMYYEDKLVNKPSSQYGERDLPDAFIIAK